MLAKKARDLTFKSILRQILEAAQNGFYSAHVRELRLQHQHALKDLGYEIERIKHKASWLDSFETYYTYQIKWE